MKIEKKEFHSSANYPAYFPSAFEQLQEFVDKLKKEEDITIYEQDTKPGYKYVLLYWLDKEED